MRELRPDLSRIAIVSVVMFLALFVAILMAFGATADVVLQSILKTGVVLSIIGFFWTYFEKHGWRYSWLRLWGWLTDIPVLHGRWEGTVCRDGESEIEHPFVLEVSQTFSTLKFRTFGEKASGESLSASIIAKDDLHSMWEVNSVWRTEARKLSDKNNYEHFTGCSTWRMSFDAQSKTYQITDRYFTSRKTSGTAKIRFVSQILLGKLK
jgi:hypothetical protein